MSKRFPILAALILVLLSCVSADAQSFFKRRGLFHRRYQSTAITAPVPQRLKATQGAPEMRAWQVATGDRVVAGASHGDVSAHNRAERREARRRAKMERRFLLAKGMQERSNLGEAIVDHSYVTEHDGR